MSTRQLTIVIDCGDEYCRREDGLPCNHLLPDDESPEGWCCLFFQDLFRDQKGTRRSTTCVYAQQKSNGRKESE